MASLKTEICRKFVLRYAVILNNSFITIPAVSEFTVILSRIQPSLKAGFTVIQVVYNLPHAAKYCVKYAITCIIQLLK